MFGRRTDPEDQVEADEASSALKTYGGWGGAALAGLIAVALAGLGQDSAQQPGGPAAQTAPTPTAVHQPVIVRTDPTLVTETQRLAEAVRTLTADRDRLAQKLDQVERSIGDVTASIPRDRPRLAQQAPPSAAGPPSPPVIAAAQPHGETPRAADTPKAELAKTEPAKTEPAKSEPARTEPARPDTVRPDTTRPAAAPPLQIAPQVAAVPTPRPRAEPNAVDSVGTRTEFGVDIGGDTSVEGLRATWIGIRGNHGQLVEGLRPLVAVRDGPRPGTVELRLVAGPLANAAAAARLCAALATSGIACNPTTFDGQRLALR